MPNHPGRRKGTRRVRLWVHGRSYEWIVEGTKAEASAFEARKRIELEANVHEIRVAPKFSVLCVEKYKPFAKANYTKSTWRARSNILTSLVLFFGETKLTDFTPGMTEQYKAHRITQSKLRAVSMNTELRTLLRVLRWAEKQGYPVAVPHVTFMREPRGRVRLWTDAEVQKLVAVTKRTHPELLGMVLFLANTGCRKGEAQAAEWSWVDRKAGMLRIPATEHWKPKSGRAREIPISSALRAVLSAPSRSERWIFPNRDGVRYERFPDAIFKQIQTAAGLSGGAHTLRHSFASFFLRDKPDIKLLAEVLGHSNTRITELYSHLLADHLEQARDVVNIGATGATTGAARRRPRKTA
jgi:integrase